MNSCTHLMVCTAVINIINGLSYVILRKEREPLVRVVSIPLDMKCFSTHKTEYLETSTIVLYFCNCTNSKYL